MEFDWQFTTSELRGSGFTPNNYRSGVTLLLSANVITRSQMLNCLNIPLTHHLRRTVSVTHFNEISGYFIVSESTLFSLKLISSQTEPKTATYIFMVGQKNADRV